MKISRKNHSAEFKSRVALEALKETRTTAELASHYGIHPTLVRAWKREVLKNIGSVFSGKTEAVEANPKSAQEIERLHAKIGQLVVERDFLLKVSGQ
ncbi:transposase [Neokomagataea anthophila]|uniref:Transposase n=1 Tax=Neokomagataea anthophila TaxID=2826925 RepID=A0ABS5EA98_9PROT|nr:transposase [Neokomagataea anthophila]MBR0560731.1 transposase [Neokomagataea anthophila]